DPAHGGCRQNRAGQVDRSDPRGHWPSGGGGARPQDGRCRRTEPQLLPPSSGEGCQGPVGARAPLIPAAAVLCGEGSTAGCGQQPNLSLPPATSEWRLPAADDLGG